MRGICFVTVGGASQREKDTEIKSGAAINAISEFKIEKYKYILPRPSLFVLYSILGCPKILSYF